MGVTLIHRLVPVHKAGYPVSDSLLFASVCILVIGLGGLFLFVASTYICYV